jgi:hypothetical protein
MKRFGAYQRRLVLTRGSTLKTSRTAPLINPELSALARSSSSTVVPLPIFMNTADFFILEKVLYALKKSFVVTIFGKVPTI